MLTVTEAAKRLTSLAEKFPQAPVGILFTVLPEEDEGLSCREEDIQAPQGQNDYEIYVDPQTGELHERSLSQDHNLPIVGEIIEEIEEIELRQFHDDETLWIVLSSTL